MIYYLFFKTIFRNSSAIFQLNTVKLNKEVFVKDILYLVQTKENVKFMIMVYKIINKETVDYFLNLSQNLVDNSHSRFTRQSHTFK